MEPEKLPKGTSYPTHVRQVSDLTDLDEPPPTPPNHPPPAHFTAQQAPVADIEVATPSSAVIGHEPPSADEHVVLDTSAVVPAPVAVQRPPKVVPGSSPPSGSCKPVSSSGHSARTGTDRPSLTGAASSLPLAASAPGLARKLARLGQLTSKRPNYVFQPSPRGGTSLPAHPSTTGGGGGGATCANGGRSRYMGASVPSPCLSPSRASPGRSPPHGRSPTRLTAGGGPSKAAPIIVAPRQTLVLGHHATAHAARTSPMAASQRCSRSPDPSNVFTRLAGGNSHVQAKHTSPLTGSVRSLSGHGSPPGQRPHFTAYPCSASVAASGHQPTCPGGSGSQHGSLRSTSSATPQSPTHSKRPFVYPFGVSRPMLTQPRVGGPAFGSQPSWSSGPSGHRPGGYVDVLSRSMSSATAGPTPVVIAPSATDNLSRSTVSLQALNTGGASSPGPYIRYPPSMGEHRGLRGGGNGCGGGAGTLGSPVGHTGGLASSPSPPHARWCFPQSPTTSYR